MAPLSWLASPRPEHLGWAGKQPLLSQTLPREEESRGQGAQHKATLNISYLCLQRGCSQNQRELQLEKPLLKIVNVDGDPQASDEECLP